MASVLGVAIMVSLDCMLQIQSSTSCLELHEQMKQQYREQAVLRSKLCPLQSVVSAASCAQTTAAVARLPASVDHWQLQRQHFGMMAADRRYAAPHADRRPDTDALLMHASTVHVLWRRMISQQCLPDDTGISVAELLCTITG